MSEVEAYLESKGVPIFHETKSAPVNVDCNVCGYEYQTVQEIALVPSKHKCVRCGSMNTKSYWFTKNET